MPRKYALVVSGIAAAAAFLALLLAAYGDAYSSLVPLVGLDAMENPLLVAASAGAVSCAVFANCLQALSGRISPGFLKAEAAAYVVVLLSVTMLKSKGVQEVNLDPLDLYRQLIECPSSVALNCILFIPLGMILRGALGSLPRSLGAGLAAVLAIESLQFALSLGIADVVDVAVNFAGVAIGSASAGRLIGRGACAARGGSAKRAAATASVRPPDGDVGRGLATPIWTVSRETVPPS